MKYKVGDVVNYRIDNETYGTLLISDVLKNKGYRGYINNHTDISTIYTSIISYGSPEEIITEKVISQLFESHTALPHFFKCIAFHLIRSTNKYDLQILNKCNYLKTIPLMVGDIKEILDELNLKYNPTITG